VSDTCKFCGADVIHRSRVIPSLTEWLCGTNHDTHRLNIDGFMRSRDCLSKQVARYEALFPIPPWSTEPISAEVCERLGMTRCSEPDEQAAYRIGEGASIVEVWSENIGWEVYFLSGYRLAHVPEAEYTAGQLACLIAARKGAVK